MPAPACTRALVGLVLVAATACGTTVPTSGLGAGLGDGLGGPSSEATVGQAPSTAALGSSSDGSAAAGPTSTSAATGSASLLPTSASVIRGARTIEIGIPYLDSSQTNAVVGGIGAGLATADTRVLYEAYLQGVNARGGVLGRRLVGVYRKLSPTASLASIAQDVCTYYSQDHKVSFVFTPPLLDLYGCLSKAGVATLSSTPQNTSKKLLQRSRLALLPESLAMDHYADIEAKEFTQMGFFRHGLTDKLGVIYFENDDASVDGFRALSKALPAYGTKIDYSEALTFADGTSGLAAMEASVQAAELKFSAEGVTEVICVEVNAFACGFFGVYAASQGYYPRYAFSGAQVLSNIVANVPAKELKDSVFLGWFPAQDLQSEAEMPATLRACFAFFRKHGVTVSTGNQRSQAEQTCSDVNFFVAAIRAAPAVSAAGLVQGAAVIGSSYRSIGTFGVKISASQRDGVSRIRRGAFVESCGCFRYTSNPTAV